MSNNLDLSQVAEAQNQKFQTINDKGAELDAALTEQVTADLSAGNATVSAAAYRRAIYIKATGAATGGRTVTLQAIKRFVAIANTSTTHSVNFILGSATITLAAASSATAPTIAVVYTDGTANGLYVVTGTTGSVVSAFTDLTDVPASYTSQALKERKESRACRRGRENLAPEEGEREPVCLIGRQGKAAFKQVQRDLVAILHSLGPCRLEVRARRCGISGTIEMLGSEYRIACHEKFRGAAMQFAAVTLRQAPVNRFMDESMRKQEFLALGADHEMREQALGRVVSLPKQVRKRSAIEPLSQH
jgi:hypothetical protein